MAVVLEGRLRDLVSTADAQLAAQSYDAAIDTYRTAFSELPGDSGEARAELESRLAAALQIRDRARGPEALRSEIHAHQTAGREQEAIDVARRLLALSPGDPEGLRICGQPPAAVVPETPAPESALMESAVIIDALPAAVPDEPASPEAVQVEPPSFHLFEDTAFERGELVRRPEYQPEPPLSILDTTPRPEQDLAKVWLALIGAVAFVIAGIFASSRHNARPVQPPSYGRVYTEGNGVSEPVVLSRVDPVYPDDARAAGIQGIVVLSVEVQPDGKARVLRILRSINSELDDSAVVAVRRWKFYPGMKDGRRVRVQTNVFVSFPPQ